MQHAIKYGKMKYGSAYDIFKLDLFCSLRINVWFHMIKIACSVGEYIQQSINADSILEQSFLGRVGEILALVCIK